MENQDNIKQIVQVQEGPDGSGKELISQIIRRLFYTAEKFNIDGKEYSVSEVVISEASFPFYAFPSGDFIRLMNRGLGAMYADERGLDVEKEVKVRKAMYGVDRLLLYAAEAITMHRYTDGEQKILLRCQDRSSLSQIHTEAAVYNRRGLPYAPNWDTLMDSDTEILGEMDFRNAVLLPYSAKTTATAVGGREKVDDLEKVEAQTIALDAYRKIAETNMFGSYPVSVQDSNGVWIDPEMIVYQIMGNSGIAPIKGVMEKPLDDNAYMQLIHSGVSSTASKFVNGILHPGIPGLKIAQAPRTHLFAFMPVAEMSGIPEDPSKSLDREWYSVKVMKDGDEQRQRYEKRSKKDILWDVEFNLTRLTDSYLRVYRVDEERLNLIPPYITKALLRLFGEYTDGLLWDLHKYIVANRNEVFRSNEETSSEYGKGYLLFLRDILEFAKTRHG